MIDVWGTIKECEHLADGYARIVVDWNDGGALHEMVFPPSDWTSELRAGIPVHATADKLAELRANSGGSASVHRMPYSVGGDA